MAKVLKVTGIILLAFGIIGGMIIISNIDWNSYEIAQQIIFIQLSLAIGSILSGIISGVLFFGLSEGLESLEIINHNLRIIAKKIIATNENTETLKASNES